MATPETSTEQNPVETAPSDNLEEAEVQLEAVEAAQQEVGETPAEQPEPSPEDQIATLDAELEHQEQQIQQITDAVEETRERLEEVREDLGLPPLTEEPRSIEIDENRLEALKEEKGELEEQKTELVSEQTREMLLAAAKEEVFQEKLKEIFEFFENLDTTNLDSLVENGLLANGETVKDSPFGSLNQKEVQAFVAFFKEGKEPKLEDVEDTDAELHEKINDEISEDAQKLADKQLEEAKKKMKENVPEQLETPKGEMQEEVEESADISSPSGPAATAPNAVSDGTGQGIE